MHAAVGSKYLLKQILNDFLDEFESSSVKNNQSYLEFQIGRLERMAAGFRNQSRNPEVSNHQRARARDLEQNSLGLINGIKFGISFMLHNEEDFAKKEGLDDIIKPKLHSN